MKESQTSGVTAFEEIVGKNTEESIETTKRKRVEWEPDQLSSRCREQTELGDTPTSRAMCFGCIWVGERDEASLKFAEIKRLIDMIRKTIARTDPVALARHVSLEYEKIRTKINAHRLNHESELPPWPEAMVLDHIRNHNTDPELQIWLRLTELQELIQISLEGMVEINPDTKRRRINIAQMRAYKEFTTLYFTVNKLVPSKLSYFSRGDFTDLKKASQSVIAFSGKKITDFFS